MEAILKKTTSHIACTLMNHASTLIFKVKCSPNSCMSRHPIEPSERYIGHITPQCSIKAKDEIFANQPSDPGRSMRVHYSTEAARIRFNQS